MSTGCSTGGAGIRSTGRRAMRGCPGSSERSWCFGSADYEEAFVPELAFPGEFTAAEFQKENRMTKRMASYTIGFLRAIGAVEKCGARGRAYLYRRVSAGNETSAGSVSE